MLDVHPPHHPTHTWQDFFIHIGTIVVGLLIAVGLEQTVEAVHRSAERRVLLHDIHGECEENLKVFATNFAALMARIQWQTSAADALRAAPVAEGSVTLILPAAQPFPTIMRPDIAVWTIAKSSGTAALLPENLAQIFDRMDHHADKFQRAQDQSNDANRDLSSRFKITTGTNVRPGESLHLTPTQRDQVLEALATSIAEEEEVNLWAATWQGDCQAILDGVTSRSEMDRYLFRARAAVADSR